MTIRLLHLVSLLCFASVAQGAPLKFPLAHTVENTRAAGLCGSYRRTSKEGLYDGLEFKGGEKATMLTGLGDRELPYFISEKRLYVLADKALLEFEIAQDTLIGADTWTQKSTFRRKSKPKSACTVFAATSAGEKEVEKLLCHLAGVDLQANQKLPEAVEQYSMCCKEGDALSCNKQGFLISMGALGKTDAKLSLELMQRSCDMG